KRGVVLLYSDLFFFSSRRRHTRFSRDWSSDVCSSDLDVLGLKDYWESGQEGIRQRNFNYSYYNNPYFIANEYLQEYKKDVVYGRSEERRVGKECRSRWWT